MTVLIAPPLEEEPWPTLGPAVADWMEASLVYGPGDLRWQPYRLSNEQRGLLYRMYEVYPKGHPQEGRRRFKRVAISLRKGSAKTEFGAAITAAELSPDSPVRCVGWRKSRGGWAPRGGPVNDPYIPMLAYTEEQSEELAFGALLVMIGDGPIARLFDVGLERVMRRGGDGKAVALAGSPDARDGARTTFQLFDETHRLTAPRHKSAHRTMLANIPKRPIADPWSLEITTMFTPGMGSVAEDTWAYAQDVIEGNKRDARLFFFHRAAGDHHDLTKREGLIAAIEEASGPGSWIDAESILPNFDDPTSDFAYNCRAWLNQRVKGSDRAFDVLAWDKLAKKGYVIPDGALVTIGFDGARYQDSTGIVVTEAATGHQVVMGVWEHDGTVNWQVPEAQVDLVMASIFETWNVWRAYCDPYWWESHLSAWAGRWGDKVVIEWRTNRLRQMATALQAYRTAMVQGELSHDGDARFRRHISNATKFITNLRDDLGEPMWTIQKERPDSNDKIDLDMAGCLSWTARNDAIASGVLEAPKKKRLHGAVPGDTP